MALSTLEADTVFGALDPDAVVDGRALDSLTLRTIGRQTNLLLRKQQIILNCVWPITTQTIEGNSTYRAEFNAKPDNEQVWPTFDLPKMPGPSSATIYFYARIPTSLTMIFTIVVLDAGVFELECAGTGDWELYSRSILIPAGLSMRVRIFHRGVGVGDLLDTGTYGTPDSGTLASTDALDATGFARPGATWTTALAPAGYIFNLYSYEGVLQASRRIASSGAFGLRWNDSIPYSLIATLQSSLNLGRPGTFDIRSLPGYALAQMAIVSDERSL